MTDAQTETRSGLRYLLDTNVLSQSSRPQPNRGVLDFLGRVNLTDLYVSVISLGEIERGTETHPDPLRRASLRLWLMQDVYHQHGANILPVTQGVMSSWAAMVIQTGKTPGQLPALDALIAATALHHGLTVVTRNTRDFQQFGVSLLNPFKEPE